MALVLKPGRGGAPNGPATYPFFNHQANVSVNSSQCRSTDAELLILAGGRVVENGTGEPDSRSLITLSALMF